jgi:hypothetical protein
MTRISKKRTVAGIRWSRGGRKASATGVKVAGIGASDVVPEEKDVRFEPICLSVVSLFVPRPTVHRLHTVYLVRIFFVQQAQPHTHPKQPQYFVTASNNER